MIEISDGHTLGGEYIIRLVLCSFHSVEIAGKRMWREGIAFKQHSWGSAGFSTVCVRAV